MLCLLIIIQADENALDKKVVKTSSTLSAETSNALSQPRSPRVKKRVTDFPMAQYEQLLHTEQIQAFPDKELVQFPEKCVTVTTQERKFRTYLNSVPVSWLAISLDLTS
jgi:hypothetical protein